MALTGRAAVIVQRLPVAAADPRQEELFVARGALKRAMQARDAARAAHVAAQHSVDELRALVQRLEAEGRTPR